MKVWVNCPGNYTRAHVLRQTSALEELSPTELGAWRGFLRVHTALVRELDAELDAAHDLPLSSYDVLIYLRAAPDSGCAWPSSPTACC